MKKLFFTLCALCLCGTMWADFDDSTGLYYSVEDEAATITVTEGSAYTLSCLVLNDDGSYSLPATLGGYPVVDVADYAFQNDFQDTANPIHLVIPANVNRLGQRSFQSCTQIEEVTLEYSSTSLTEGSNANYYNSFYGCSGIKTVNVYRNVTYTRGNDLYHTGMFSYQTSIETVNIGAEVTSFVHYMFSSEAENVLTTVNCYIDTPITLATGVFENINSKAVLYVHPYSVDAYKASDWADIFSDIQPMDEEEEEQPEGTLMDVTTGLFFDYIDVEVNGETVTYLSIIADQESGAYYDANLVPHETIANAYTLPSYVEDKSGEGGYVTRIDESAFANSAVSGHLVIPANIERMGASAFAYCTGLTEVTYEYGDTMYEENQGNQTGGSFQGCSGVTTVNLYRDIELTGSNSNQTAAFVGTTSVATINIGPRVTEIPQYMFRNTTYASYGGGPIKTINSYAVVPPTLTNSPFARMGDNILNVPQGTADVYSSASVWTAQINSDGTGNDYGICTLNEMSDAFAITTHDNGEGTAYATFYNSASDVELFDDGTETELTAYYAYQLDNEDDGLYIEIAEIGNTIPAATGVIVETPTAGTYLAIATGEKTEFSGNNDLYGYDTAQTIANPSGSYYYYLLSSYNDVVGFYWGAEDGGAFTCQAHKAYLALSQDDVKDANQISIRKGNGGEDTTGISSVESATEGATVKGIYTIQGVRVSNMNQPGLYIVDGKKVLVK